MIRVKIALALAAGQPAVRTVALPAPNATLPAELTSVSAIRELRDGRVLIVDRGDKKLLVADLAGRTAVQIGRNGSGPNEYLQLSPLFALPSDSTLAPDSRNGRWLLLHGSTIVATIGATAAVIVNGARLPRGVDHRGNVIATRPISALGAAVGSMSRGDSLVLLRVSRGAGAVDTIATLRARPTAVKTTGPREKPTSVSVFINPLAPGEYAALCADGWVAVARIEPYRVDWIGPGAERVAGQPLPFETVRVDDREKRAVLDRQAERTGEDARDPAAVPDWPAVMPPFGNDALHCAPDGRLWIQRVATAADPAPRYEVIDRAGKLVARVRATRGVGIVGFGRDVVYTVTTDDNGIQRLERRPFPLWIR
jgi:hypothetical protein